MMMGDSNTECCNCVPEQEASTYTCEDRKLVFSKREQEVLKKIREASLKAREVKERIRLSFYIEERRAAEKELDELRALRRELEAERIEAADERMRLLGHLS